MSLPDVSIIIVSWNTCAMLARALACIDATTHRVNVEVIVVDNHSDDGSAEMVEAQFPNVTLIRNHDNAGFARANNHGAHLARGRYVLLLNSDAFVREGAIDTLVEFMDVHPDAGAAGCRLFYEDGVLQRSCMTFPTLTTELWIALHLDQMFPSSHIFGKYMMTHWDMSDTREVDAVMGACVMLRSSAIAQTGLFDEQFFMYSEEIDLCYRLKRDGWKVYFVPDAEATHVWGGSAKKVQGETLIRLYRSRVQFFRKHYGGLRAVLFKLILALSSMLRIAGGAVSYLIRRNRDSFQRSQMNVALFKALWAF